MGSQKEMSRRFGMCCLYNLTSQACQHSIVHLCRWGATPLQDALLGGHDLVCDLIRSCGGRLELEHAPKALGQAASAGDIRRISLLVENGVPVDTPDYDGRTALHLAATEGQLLSVYILLHRYAHEPASAQVLQLWLRFCTFRLSTKQIIPKYQTEQQHLSARPICTKTPHALQIICSRMFKRPLKCLMSVIAGMTLM